MNTIVRSASLASAATVSATAFGASPLFDEELVEASHQAEIAKLTLDGMYHQFGDSADSRRDYRRLEQKQSRCLKTLATIPAKNWRGIVAKASVLSESSASASDPIYNEIAASLARDLLHMAGAPG